MIVAFLPLLLFSYELGMSDIQVPSVLSRNALELEVRHRFGGDITDHPFENFLGMDGGANVNLGLKYTIFKGFEFGVSRTSKDREIALVLSYSHSFPKAFIRGRIGMDFITSPGFFPNLTLQTEPILGRIEPFLAAGYYFDSKRQQFGLGTGLSVTLLKDVYYFEDISLVAEYFPLLEQPLSIPELEWTGTYAFGIAASTYGHQFIFTLSNSTDLGTRRIMQGTSRYFEDEDLHLYLGFSVRRLLIRGKE